TLWLARASAELRLLEFRYTNLSPGVARAEPGGSVEFLRLSTGGWLMGRWMIRAPQVARKLSPFSTPGVAPESTTVAVGLQFNGGEVTAVNRGGELLFRRAAESGALASVA